MSELFVVFVLVTAILGFIASYGLWRLQDTLSRLHSCSTLSPLALTVALFIAGLIAPQLEDKLKIFLTWIGVLLTHPVASHIIGALVIEKVRQSKN